MYASRIRLGIDENGLGPRLGPLVVTGVGAALSEPGHTYLSHVDMALLPRIADSKQVVAHNNIALAEAWARALVPSAKTPNDLLTAISIDPLSVLQAPCPPGVEAQCWGWQGESFQAPSHLMDAILRDAEHLAQSGVSLLGAKSVVICAQQLHAAKDQGRSLFQVDLRAMERIALAFREKAPTELDAVCGKVGGYNRYLAHFGSLRDRRATIQIEGRAQSVYHVEGLGRMAFVRDADGSDILVALASLVGKYLRELLMGKISQFYRQNDPSLPNPSGYHDPVTQRFVLATSRSRQATGIPDRCFLRPCSSAASAAAQPNSVCAVPRNSNEKN